MMFKPGDRVVCTCGTEACTKYATILDYRYDGFIGHGIYVVKFDLEKDVGHWSKYHVSTFFVDAELFDSPLWRALE